MENQNNKLKHPRAVPSEMEYREKAQWKVGDNIITAVGGAEKKSVAFIKLERYDDNKKPVFSCRDLDGNSLSEETSNLYELKRNLKDKEIELTEAMQKKEVSRENPNQDTPPIPQPEKKEKAPEVQKGNELKKVRSKKADKEKENEQTLSH